MSKKRKLGHMAGKAPKPGGGRGSGKKNSQGRAPGQPGQPGKPIHPSKPGHAAAAAAAVSSPSPSSSTTTPPTIPFDAAAHRILLVGEGDLSFGASLAEHHGCAHLTATVFDADAAALAAKYPHAAANAARIEAAGGRVLYGVDATTMGPMVATQPAARAGRKGARRNRPALDRILFNFPHVGGKSTDVNRQVRANQELLVGFFRRALLALAPGGAVVVTLFEGEPYTLWNIRDLARHAGLQVERSFRFQFAAYPGYHHARTLGVVRRKVAAGRGATDGGDSKGDGKGDGKDADAADTAAAADADNRRGAASTTAWKGEDRAARSYVFVRKDDVLEPLPKKKRKRPGDESSDDSSDDDGSGSD